MPVVRGQTVLGSHAYRSRVAEYGIMRSIPTGASMRALVPSAEDRRPKPHTKRSPLPSWYPRKPLRDITFIVKAIETRRAELQATRYQINNGVNISPGAGSSSISVPEQEPTTPEAPSSSIPQSAVSVTATSSGSKSPASVTTFDSATKAVVSPEDFFNNKEITEEGTAHSAQATSEVKKKILEELAHAVEEHLKTMTKVTVEKPRRSTLLMLR